MYGISRSQDTCERNGRSYLWLLFRINGRHEVDFHGTNGQNVFVDIFLGQMVTRLHRPAAEQVDPQVSEGILVSAANGNLLDTDDLKGAGSGCRDTAPGGGRAAETRGTRQKAARQVIHAVNSKYGKGKALCGRGTVFLVF